MDALKLSCAARSCNVWSWAILSIVLTLASPLPCAAGVTVDEGQTYCGKMACLRVDGEIGANDAATLARIESTLRPRQTIWIKLDSRGGDVASAMEMGRQLRRHNAIAIVPENAVCLSSCVFLLAGATQRGVFGQVGIHRPYTTSVAEKTQDQRQQSYSEMRSAVKVYLAEMNLPDDLFKAMERVGPEQIRILSEDDLSTFGLNQTDPVADEDLNAMDARKYGISMSELLARKARAEKECADQEVAEKVACTIAIESGRR
jgi:hypothetical protein